MRVVHFMGNRPSSTDLAVVVRRDEFVLFHLTPALSLGERGNLMPRGDNSGPVVMFGRWMAMLPLLGERAG